MATTAFAAIRAYLDLIHTEFIWPTVAPPSKGKKAPGPDKLVRFHRVLMETYVKAVKLFDPGVRECRTNDQCAPGETCVSGKCVPTRPSGRAASLTLKHCTGPDDCEQDELCIDFVCVPIGINFSLAALNDVPTYGENLREELLEYYHRILAVLVGGLAKKPSRLGAARDLLTEAYAQAWKIAGTKTKACNANGDCADGEVCIDGVCVPVPFRLVFRPSGNR